MNTQLLSGKLEKFGLVILTFFFSVMSMAQDATKTPDLNVDVTTTKTTTTEEWFTNPIYWVIGALVLIIIIALVARGGGNKN
ncbi:hypothetical protein [Kaistella montana]|uniref:Uncharacterized protein n=1 Tax=Kaistella montana TaxID=1849733 RepID=A0ABW5K9L7_9FLAO|nr:hypothetical protein [Kaistella montana]MCQ4035937.1 hypothetical protein [Kaistella montana]